MSQWKIGAKLAKQLQVSVCVCESACKTVNSPSLGDLD